MESQIHEFELFGHQGVIYHSDSGGIVGLDECRGL